MLVPLVPPLPAVGTARAAFNTQTKQVYVAFSTFLVRKILLTDRTKIYMRYS